ncbi:MAG: carbohydrate kinase [Bacteroidales bacterium]|nr:MAG: carbohydrate kinase [Bacteroidales bacterium]
MEIANSKILCIGEMLWDMLPTGPKPGGAPMNVALQLNNIGLDVQFASRIGNEEQGLKLKSFLEESGMNTALIQLDSELPTSEVLVHLDDKNNAKYEICEPVAWDHLEYTEQLSHKVKESGIIVFGTLGSRNKIAKQTILNVLDSDCLKVIDVNLRPPFDQKEDVELLLGKADIAKLNDEELIQISGWYGKTSKNEEDLMRWFSEQYQCSMVCVTKGANGAVLFTNNQFFNHLGYKVVAVDAVGAGDAFLAGFLSALVHNKSPEEALDFGSATGAFVVSKEGATPKYDMSEVLRIMNQS